MKKMRITCVSLWSSILTFEIVVVHFRCNCLYKDFDYGRKRMWTRSEVATQR